MKTNDDGKIYYFQPHPSKDKAFTPIQEIQANFDLLKSIELGTGRAMGISSNEKLLEWKQEKKAPNQKKNEFPFLMAKPVYLFHKIKFSKVLLNKTMCLGLESSGSVLVWGEHKEGLLGLGYTITSVDSPTRLESLREIVDIALSDSHAIGLNCIGEAFSWGTGKYGELGLDKSIYTPTPLKVNSARTYARVFVGNLLTCFLDSEGRFSYYGVIIKILKGTLSFITVKNLLNDQSNSNPDTLFQEKIIVELELESFSSVSIGNGFIALLSRNGIVYTLEHSDKLTALYTKYFVYSLTVASNQILALSYEKPFSIQTHRINSLQSKPMPQPNVNQLSYFFCQWTSKASDKDVSSEIWTTRVYRITEDLRLDCFSLLNSNNRNVILLIERGANLNSSVLIHNTSAFNRNVNTSNDISWDNMTYNEVTSNPIGIMKKHNLNNGLLFFESEYDDSFNMKFKRSKLNVNKDIDKRSASPLLNRTMLIGENKSPLQHNKSCSSALLCQYTDRETTRRMLTNSTQNNNKSYYDNIDSNQSVEGKEKELKDYQKEIDCIITNFKLRQKEKTTNLKQQIIKHHAKSELNALDISNSTDTRRRHSGTNAIIQTNPNEVNKEQSIEKKVYAHLDTSNVNIETKNNISDIDGFLNKTRNENTLIKNELYSELEEVNLFNKSNCLLDDSSQLKLSSNFVFINPNKSNFLSPQFIKTSRFTKFYSSKEQSPNATLKNTQKNLDKEVLSKLKMSGDLGGIVSSESSLAVVQQFSLVDNAAKDQEKPVLINVLNLKGCHFNTEASDKAKQERLDTQSTIKTKKNQAGGNFRSYSNDKNRIPNSYHKRNKLEKKDKSRQSKASTSKPENDNNNHLQCQEVLINRNKNRSETKQEMQGLSSIKDLSPIHYKNEKEEKMIDESNKMPTVAYMENSSNFAYNNDNFFEETPKFDTKNLLRVSLTQSLTQKRIQLKGDNEKEAYTNNRNTSSKLESTSSIEDMRLKRFNDNNEAPSLISQEKASDPLKPDLNEAIDSKEEKSHLIMKTHETSIRQVTSSIVKTLSEKKEEAFSGSDGQGHQLEIESQAIGRNEKESREETANQMLFSFEPKIEEAPLQVKEEGNKMKDYVDIIYEIKQGDSFRKTVALTAKSARSQLRLESSSRDGINEEEEESPIKKQQLFQSNEDSNCAQLSHIEEDKVKKVKHLSDEKRIHDNQKQSAEGKKELEYFQQQQIKTSMLIQKTLIDQKNFDSHEKELPQNDNPNCQEIPPQLQSNDLTNTIKLQSNVIIFHKDKSLLSTSPSSKCQMNAIDEPKNPQSTHIKDSFDTNTASTKLLLPRSLPLTKLTINPNPHQSSEDPASTNIFNYKSALRRDSPTELIASQSNNDTARLGEKDEDVDERQLDNLSQEQLKRSVNRSQHSPSDDYSVNKKKQFLIETTGKEYISQRDYRISTIKDKIKSEENIDDEEEERASSHRRFFTKRSSGTNAKDNEKLLFDSTQKEAFVSIEERNKQKEEVISKLFTYFNNHTEDQKGLIASKTEVNEVPSPEKVVYRTVKHKRDSRDESNSKADDLLNNRSTEEPTHKYSKPHLPKDINYHLMSMPSVKGILINAEDTFGINDSSSIDKEAKRTQSMLKAITPDKQSLHKDITFFPSTDKKSGKHSLSIKIPDEDSTINMPRQIRNDDDQLSSNRNSNNGPVLENSCNATDQKIFTLKGNSNYENDSSIRPETSNIYSSNTNHLNNESNNAMLSQLISTKSIDDDNKPSESERIIQLISKIKSSQSQIETSMTKGQTLLKKKESSLETHSTQSNRINTNPNCINDNFYTFSNNAQVSCNIATNGTFQQHQQYINDQYGQLNNKIITNVSKDSTEKQKTRNSKCKPKKQSVNSKRFNDSIHEPHENSINSAKRLHANLNNSKSKVNAVKLSTEPNVAVKSNGRPGEVKYKKIQKDRLNSHQDNQSKEDSITNKHTQSIQSKADTPSSEKKETSRLVELVSAKKFQTKEAFAMQQSGNPPLSNKSIINRNSLNYFTFLVNDYMKRVVASYCIEKICTYLSHKRKEYTCRLLSRLVKRKIIFYEMKFFHRITKINKYLIKQSNKDKGSQA